MPAADQQDQQLTPFGRAFTAVMRAHQMSRTQVAVEVSRIRPRGAPAANATTMRNALEGPVRADFVEELLDAVEASDDERRAVWRGYFATVFERAGVPADLDDGTVLGGWHDFVQALDTRAVVEGLPTEPVHARQRAAVRRRGSTPPVGGTAQRERSSSGDATRKR